MSQRTPRRRTILARGLRRNATNVESLLWYKLRESFPTLKFRRQHPIGRRIADFACPARKLVIELDGGQHLEQAASDEMRTTELELSGYRVIRFWNNEVLENLEGVLEAIRLELEKTPPHPTLSAPEGRRGNNIIAERE